MEKLTATFKQRKLTRYDLIVEIAKRLGERKGKWLRFTEGIDHKDLDELYRSAESLCIDAGLSFGKSWGWHWREFEKSLVDNPSCTTSKSKIT